MYTLRFYSYAVCHALLKKRKLNCSNVALLIRTHLFNLPEIQNRATSCVWVQSSTPIGLAGQSMSLLSVPKQRSSSSHVRVVDDDWEKL